ncbi:MAG: FGGY-family carbohydrate kinase, partial [Pseudonocardiaceae bacterium]
NELLMQFQADILGVPVIRPVISETTAVGAAYAAGLAVGFWSSPEEIRGNWAADRQWDPTMDPQRREELYAQWCKAVSRTLGWVDG